MENKKIKVTPGEMTMLYFLMRSIAWSQTISFQLNAIHGDILKLSKDQINDLEDFVSPLQSEFESQNLALLSLLTVVSNRTDPGHSSDQPSPDEPPDPDNIPPETFYSQLSELLKQAPKASDTGKSDR